LFVIDEEKIGQKRRKKINHFNQFFDGSGGNPPGGGGGGGFFGSFGDSSSGGWSFGMGGAGGAGGGHGNMHGFGGGASGSGSGSYGNQHQQQRYPMGGHPFAAEPLPPVNSLFEPQQGNYYPPSYPPMGGLGFRDRGAGGRSEVKKENDPTTGAVSAGKGELVKYYWNIIEYCFV